MTMEMRCPVTAYPPTIFLWRYSMQKDPEHRGAQDGESGNLSRRKFLATAGIVAAGGVLAGCNRLSSEAAAATAPPLPWKYTKLDPEEAGRRGYKNYLLNGG
jgi:hypothetical protein